MWQNLRYISVIILETANQIERKNRTSSDTDHMKSASGQRPKTFQCKTGLWKYQLSCEQVQFTLRLKEYAEYIKTNALNSISKVSFLGELWIGILNWEKSLMRGIQHWNY